jgi:hypothetical protein
MATWTLESIPWRRFDPAGVDRVTLGLAKTACLVEHNSGAYGRYLRVVFACDQHLCAEIERWTAEELQHGMALRQWCEHADPGFDFDAAFTDFTGRIHLPTGSGGSVRGSRVGELLARCVVECGTSLYYSSLRRRSREPVLAWICGRIAADEFHHYRMFLDSSRRWTATEPLSLPTRLRVLVGRMVESEDDELAYAWHCCVGEGRPYRRREALAAYLTASLGLLRRRPVERSLGMVLRAAGLDPAGRMHLMIKTVLVRVVHWRMRKIAAATRPYLRPNGMPVPVG